MRFRFISVDFSSFASAKMSFIARLRLTPGQVGYREVNSNGRPRRDFAGWYSVDLLPPQLFLARTGALPAVPPIVLEVSARGFRLRQVAVLLFTRGTARSAGLQPLSRSGAKREMGRLRQATFRRATASGGLCRPLHPPGGHFQS